MTQLTKTVAHYKEIWNTERQDKRKIVKFCGLRYVDSLSSGSSIKKCTSLNFVCGELSRLIKILEKCYEPKSKIAHLKRIKDLLKIFLQTTYHAK